MPHLDADTCLADIWHSPGVQTAPGTHHYWPHMHGWCWYRRRCPTTRAGRQRGRLGPARPHGLSCTSMRSIALQEAQYTDRSSNGVSYCTQYPWREN